MARVIDISDWIIKEWVTTTGTREKCFVENPADGKLYFFKESIDKYPSEFWSEIIASKIGKQLGFNIIDYNIGIYKNKVGCISESIIDSETQELIHGVNILKKEIQGYIITDRPIVSFNEIERALSNYRGFINKFIEILIFDALIGNQDRHSENWALIRSLDTTNLELNKSRVVQYMANIYSKYLQPLKTSYWKKLYQQSFDELSLFDYKFSPIYDSGSSLGREMNEEQIEAFISNPEEVLKYIKRGVSEIKLKGKNKTHHFEIILEINGKYKEIVTSCRNRVLSKYSFGEISNIINHVDDDLDIKYAQNKLTLSRKKLIINIIKYRVEYFKSLNLEN
jgi:hypothetical protein